MSREALKQALEALEDRTSLMKWQKAISAIREALAQPEQDQFKPDWNTEAVLVEEMQRMAKRIEELEALVQPEQEPVAIVHRNEYNEYRLEPHDNFDIKSIPFNVDVPLFKSPQRTWVGLTNEDLDYLCHLAYSGDEEFALAVQAKLKEKNSL